MSFYTLLKNINYTKKIYINTADFFKAQLDVKIAESKSEIKEAQKLRYKVFFSERSYQTRFTMESFKKETDRFDKYSDHIVVTYKKSKFSKMKIIGTYRLLKQDVAINKSGFYSSNEYNLEKLISSNKYHKMLELSGSCIHENFRNKNILQLMWREIHNYIKINNIDALFGTASFLNIDISKIENQLIFLNNNFKMPDEIKVEAHKDHKLNINYNNKIDINKTLFKNLPTLIKGYIKLNAYVGEGAVVDEKFKTTDIFIFLPVVKINYNYLNKIIKS